MAPSVAQQRPQRPQQQQQRLLLLVLVAAVLALAGGSSSAAAAASAAASAAAQRRQGGSGAGASEALAAAGSVATLVADKLTAAAVPAVAARLGGLGEPAATAPTFAPSSDVASAVERLTQLAANITATMTRSAEYADRIRDASLDLYRRHGATEVSSDYEYWDSSGRLPPLAPEPVFANTPVSLAHSTVKFAPTLNPEAPSTMRSVAWTARLDQLFQDNLNEAPDLKWQSIGLANGLYRAYPGSEWSSTDGVYNAYDPRGRGWYVEGASGPKNVVVLLDSSGSMASENRLATALEAIRAVISSLTLNDYVTVITFDEVAREVAPCFNGTLRRATSLTKAELTRALDDVVAGGRTDFQAPFRLAFDILTRSEALSRSSRCQTTILFLTDGFATDPSQIIADGRAALGLAGENVRLLAFTMGDQADPLVPSTIACDSGGVYGHIIDGGDIRTSMLLSFTKLGAGNAVWSAPYIDVLGLGFMISRAVPIYDGDELIGVALQDMTLGAMEQQINFFMGSYFSRSEAYAFMLYADGTAVIHPRLRTIDDWIAHDIMDLETSDGAPAEFAEVRRAMVRRETGSRTLAMPRVVPRGGAGEGFRTEMVNTTYYYMPVEESDFVLCLAVPADTAYVPVDPPTASFATGDIGSKTIFEQIDQIPGVTPTLTPQRPDVPVVLDRVSFAVPAAATCDPNAHLSDLAGALPSTFTLNETQNAMQYAASAIAGNPPCTANETVVDGVTLPMWKTDARAGVRLGAGLADLMTGIAARDSSIVWAYVAMAHSGVFTLWPASQVGRAYDARTRPWYLRAARLPLGTTSVSPPYTDYVSTATQIPHRIVTISQRIPVAANATTVAGPNATGVIADAGVYGIDLDYNTFATAVDSAFGAACDATDAVCGLIDDNGFWVYHPDFASAFANSTSSAELGEFVLEFIGEQYAVLLLELEERGFLTATTGDDYSTGCVSGSGTSIYGSTTPPPSSSDAGDSDNDPAAANPVHGALFGSAAEREQIERRRQQRGVLRQSSGSIELDRVADDAGSTIAAADDARMMAARKEQSEETLEAGADASGQRRRRRQASTVDYTDCQQRLTTYAVPDDFQFPAPRGVLEGTLQPTVVKPVRECMQASYAVAPVAGTNLYAVALSNIKRSSSGQYLSFDGVTTPCPSIAAPIAEVINPTACEVTEPTQERRRCAAKAARETCRVSCPDDCSNAGDCVDGECTCNFNATVYDSNNCADPDATEDDSFEISVSTLITIIAAVVVVCICCVIGFFVFRNKLLGRNRLPEDQAADGSLPSK